MPPSHQLSHLRPASQDRGGETVRSESRKEDVQWGSPIFRAPSLPTPRRAFTGLPFPAHFRPAKIQRA